MANNQAVLNVSAWCLLTTVELWPSCLHKGLPTIPRRYQKRSEIAVECFIHAALNCTSVKIDRLVELKVDSFKSLMHACEIELCTSTSLYCFNNFIMYTLEFLRNFRQNRMMLSHTYIDGMPCSSSQDAFGSLLPLPTPPMSQRTTRKVCVAQLVGSLTRVRFPICQPPHSNQQN